MQYESEIIALLYVSGDAGISARTLASLLQIAPAAARESVKSVTENINNQDLGVKITEYDDNYKMVTDAKYGHLIENYYQKGTEAKLSQAALEVLAIIAYRQPITRIEIDEIRGVRSSGTIQTLVARRLIEEAGRKEVTGKPILYRTTADFLDYFGLKSLDDLPELEELSNSELDQKGNLDLFYDKLKNIDNSGEE